MFEKGQKVLNLLTNEIDTVLGFSKIDFVGLGSEQGKKLTYSVVDKNGNVQDLPIEYLADPSEKSL